MASLTIRTMEEIMDVACDLEQAVLDLRFVGFVDPYALLLLKLVLLFRDEQASPLKVRWPERPAVRRWIDAMQKGKVKSRSDPSSQPSHGRISTLQPITRIDDEASIGGVVDGFEHRLAEQYPMSESSRRALTAIMIELFQNIPHHSNATGEVDDPHGIAAMQDYQDSIVLAIADKGVGLRNSLSICDETAVSSDQQALQSAVLEGTSRFTDPGRGGELQKVERLVRFWDGELVVRTGEALLLVHELGAEFYDVARFPGVQIALRLPRRLFLDPEVEQTEARGFNEDHG